MLQRHWCWENSSTLDASDLDTGDGDESSNEDDLEGAMSTKKRKVTRGSATVGKSIKGQDFWSCMDAWWMGRITEWGTNIKNERWRPYGCTHPERILIADIWSSIRFISKTIRLDKARFGQTLQSCLEPLPTGYVPMPHYGEGREQALSEEAHRELNDAIPPPQADAMRPSLGLLSSYF